MTHPDTLQTPRAVVEQAKQLALTLRNDGAEQFYGYEIASCIEDLVAALRAALQPQAADDKIKALAAKAPKDVRIYPGGGEVIPQAAAEPVSLQPAHDSITIDQLNGKVMRQQEAMRLALEALKFRKCWSDEEGEICATAIAALEGSLK
jgi:hypothetical protein